MTHEDWCSCYKPNTIQVDGTIYPMECYGQSGWHFFVVSPATIERDARKFEAAGDRDKAEWARKTAASYVDNVIAYEPCPHFRAKVREEIDAKKARV